MSLVNIWGPIPEQQLLAGRSPEERERLLKPFLEKAQGDRPVAVSLLGTAMYAGMASRRLAQSIGKYAPAYLYRFEATPTPGRSITPGSPHGTELFHVFSSLDTFRFRPDSITTSERELASKMTDYWASFARSGVPASQSGPIWPRHDPKDEAILLVTNEGATATRFPYLNELSAAPAQSAIGR